MKIYITARFAGSKDNRLLQKLCRAVKEAGHTDYCFVRDVEEYKDTFKDAKKLMKRTKEELLKCDALLIDETDNPGGGRMIEAGIAFDADKKIIVIARQGTVVRNTLAGVADKIIFYDQIEDIKKELLSFKV